MAMKLPMPFVFRSRLFAYINSYPWRRSRGCRQPAGVQAAGESCRGEACRSPTMSEVFKFCPRGAEFEHPVSRNRS